MAKKANPPTAASVLQMIAVLPRDPEPSRDQLFELAWSLTEASAARRAKENTGERQNLFQLLEWFEVTTSYDSGTMMGQYRQAAERLKEQIGGRPRKERPADQFIREMTPRCPPGVIAQFLVRLRHLNTNGKPYTRSSVYSRQKTLKLR